MIQPSTGAVPGPKNRFLPILVALVSTLAALYPSNPQNMTLPSRDSGVFLYVGWRWINGDIPYRDVWDHKPPLVYVLDAVGLTLTSDTMWGVWLLQFVFIFTTIFLIYIVLDREFGVFAALTGAVILTSGLVALLEQGNVTEEYALLFQAACFLLFVAAHQHDYPRRTTFWIGLCAGLAFNFKQTTIGVWIAYGLIVFATRLRQRKSPIMDFLALMAGWLLPTIVIVIYFASQNALSDFWGQAYVYNFIYINKHEGLRSLIPVFSKGFLLLTQGGILYLTTIAGLAGAGYLWVRRKETAKSLVWIAVVALPIEVLLITTSGRSIIHYYLTLLPVAAVLTGSMTHTLQYLVGKTRVLSQTKTFIPLAVLLIALLFQANHVRNYSAYVQTMALNEYAQAIAYIEHNTKADDKVLIIGAESVVNFLTRREAPTRYVYQYPLQLLGRRPMFEEYFNQILENKPVLIIDTRGRTKLTDNLYKPLQNRSEVVRDGVAYLGESYEQVAQFGEWFVYRWKEAYPPAEGGGG